MLYDAPVASVLEAAVAAELVIRYQLSNSFPRTEKNVSKPKIMPYGIFKPPMASLFHEIAWGSSNARHCVSPHTLPSTALSKVPSWLLLPKTHANCPFPKTVFGSLPRLLLLVIPPQTHTGCLCHNTRTGTPCHHPHSGCPFPKKYPCFRHSILELSLAFSAPKFQDGSTPLDRTRCFYKKTRDLKFCECETQTQVYYSKSLLHRSVNCDTLTTVVHLYAHLSEAVEFGNSRKRQ